jgi:hypothetical protein
MSLDKLLKQRAAELGYTQHKPFQPAERPPVEGDERDASFMRRAESWCRKALEGRAEKLATIPIGNGRNVELNRSTWVLLRFALAGHLDVQEVLDTMGEADGGADYPATRKTLESAWNGAHKHGPLDPPIDATSTEDFFELVYTEAKKASPWMPDVEVPPMPEVTSETLEERARRAHSLAVMRELAYLRARDEAGVLFAAEKAAKTFREPPSRPTLTEELLIPDEPVRFAVDKLLPVGGNALLTAQYKAGKTTLVTNLARSFADGEPFLGRFEMSSTRTGRIAIFNYELSEAQYRIWLREAGIRNTDAISVLHLRGYRLPLTAKSIEDWIVAWLVDHDVSMWVADPFARAAVGVDENSNTEVGVWLDTFDVIKQRAGVSEGILPVHTGRTEQDSGKERARGATRLDDWADVRWLLTRDEQGERYFRATGRDVEVDEEKLTYSEADRCLLFGGGNKSWIKRRRMEDVVVQWVGKHPGSTGQAVEHGVEGKATEVRAALKGAAVGHRLRVEEGPRGARYYFSNE